MAYDFNDSSEVGNIAIEKVTKLLESVTNVIKVENVEKIKEYQDKDIDLIVHFTDNETGKVEQVTIEVKGDTYDRTKNYFFETISNELKATQGCFMKTEANWFYYYFVNSKELHTLPMPECREWFIEKFKANNMRFEPKPVQTRFKNGKGQFTTWGRLVPIENIRNDVEIAVIDVEKDIKSNKLIKALYRKINADRRKASE